MQDKDWLKFAFYFGTPSNSHDHLRRIPARSFGGNTRKNRENVGLEFTRSEWLSVGIGPLTTLVVL